MLNDLENVIKNFFNQYGFTVKSSNSQIGADQVARLLADQVFLHIIAQGIAPKAAVRDAELLPIPAPKQKKSKDTPAKPKRKYQRKEKTVAETTLEGAV